MGIKKMKQLHLFKSNKESASKKKAKLIEDIYLGPKSPYTDYDKYINSKEWRNKRRRAIHMADYRCQKCGKKKEIFQIHHKHYATLFHERFKDVEVLCISCHRKADKDRKYWAAYETWAYKKYGENWAYCDDESLRDEFDAWLDSKQ